MTRVLVTGARGQVGWEMTRVLHPFFEVIAADRDVLDLAQPQGIAQTAARLAPDLIVNCGAYTAVDRAEGDPATARLVNVDAVHELGSLARRLNMPVVHFSTDYVFAGDAHAPYTETDPTAPRCVYGETKLAGEQALAASDAAHWIFRTSWVYSARGRNFVKAILHRARETGSLRVVADQRGSPTWARTLAEVVGALVVPHAGGREQLIGRVGETRGTYHVASRGAVSWYEFAQFIVEQLSTSIDRQVLIEPITTAEFPAAARRPAFSVLSTEKLRRTFGVELPDWRAAAGLCLAELGELMS